MYFDMFFNAGCLLMTDYRLQGGNSNLSPTPSKALDCVYIHVQQHEASSSLAAKHRMLSVWMFQLNLIRILHHCNHLIQHLTVLHSKHEHCCTPHLHCEVIVL